MSPLIIRDGTGVLLVTLLIPIDFYDSTSLMEGGHVLPRS